MNWVNEWTTSNWCSFVWKAFKFSGLVDVNRETLHIHKYFKNGRWIMTFFTPYIRQKKWVKKFTWILSEKEKTKEPYMGLHGFETSPFRWFVLNNCLLGGAAFNILGGLRQALEEAHEELHALRILAALVEKRCLFWMSKIGCPQIDSVNRMEEPKINGCFWFP